MIAASPDLPLARLERALALGREVLERAGLVAELPEVGLAVEAHRWAWRPAVPRVLLIAESHVYTSPQDIALHMRPGLLPPEAHHAPTAYVRLVYCLGYGESMILDRPVENNRGTPQFWNIFGRLAGTGRQPTTLQASWQERIAWKVRTLLELQARGVWLLDASLHGIYAPGAVRVPPSVTFDLHRIWWDCYGYPILREWPHAYRCVIGRGMARTCEELRIPFDNWIYQPQARAGAGVDLESGWRELLERVEQRQVCV